jgi:hypothetical protein
VTKRPHRPAQRPRVVRIEDHMHLFKPSQRARVCQRILSSIADDRLVDLGHGRAGVPCDSAHAAAGVGGRCSASACGNRLRNLLRIRYFRFSPCPQVWPTDCVAAWRRFGDLSMFSAASPRVFPLLGKALRWIIIPSQLLGGSKLNGDSEAAAQARRCASRYTLRNNRRPPQGSTQSLSRGWRQAPPRTASIYGR